MKKILFLILFISIILTSCEYLPEQLQPSPKPTEQTASFTAAFDYGLHTEGKATLLLSGSNVFFDTEQWGIGRINAGDVIMILECRNDYFRFDKPILSAFA